MLLLFAGTPMSPPPHFGQLALQLCLGMTCSVLCSQQSYFSKLCAPKLRDCNCLSSSPVGHDVNLKLRLQQICERFRTVRDNPQQPCAVGNPLESCDSPKHTGKKINLLFFLIGSRKKMKEQWNSFFGSQRVMSSRDGKTIERGEIVALIT